jgi:membrane-associated protein
MLDFLLHLDQNLTSLIGEYGVATYVILFFIIVLETGCVLTVFLPGDSLLVVAGAGAASGLLHLSWLVLVFFLAGVCGDILGYAIGHHIGLRVLRERFPDIVRTEHIERTTRYFARFGKKTVFIGRFIPVIRTFVPLLAGVGRMERRAFATYNILSAACWALLMTGAGYLLGKLPWIQEYIALILFVVLVFTLVTLMVILAALVHGTWKKKLIRGSA